MRESVDYSYENTKIKEKKWICGMVSREGLGVGYVLLPMSARILSYKI